MGRWVVLGFALGAALWAQDSGRQELANGKLLVAARALRDPNFAETVVLLVDVNDRGTIGLVLNRRTKAPLSKVFPLPEDSKIGADPVYSGGPVEPAGALALLASDKPSEGARRIFDGVYLASSRPLLDKALAEGRDANRFRVYLGYGGWAPGQLEAEVELGAWRVLAAKTGLVFDAEPDSLWDRLNRLAKTEIAGLVPRGPRSSRADDTRPLWPFPGTGR